MGENVFFCKFALSNSLFSMLKHISVVLLTVFFSSICSVAQTRHWTVADGLPTGEVRQMIELPNGQMLVNCEGVFCLSNGRDFTTLPCERNKAFRRPQYTNGYAYVWQGDSLLWLSDFFRIYLFDTRTLSFRYDMKGRLTMKGDVCKIGTKELTADTTQTNIGDQTWVKNPSCVATDRQGGVWIGTRNDGIYYIPPQHPKAHTYINAGELTKMSLQTTDHRGRRWHCRMDGLVCEDQGQTTTFTHANVEGMKGMQTCFITEQPDHRFLISHILKELGYFDADKKTFTSLNARLPQLAQYRYFVGACLIDDRWTAVYTQNGAFLLDTKEDTLADFPEQEKIENYSDKYNCMLRDRQGRLWVGTQNGLFVLTPKPARTGVPQYDSQHIKGLSNNCIRSMVLDAEERVWVGTSCGISRVTPSVINLGTDDGVPPTSMRDRAACLTDDGHLVFVYATSAILFHPDSLILSRETFPVVLTSVSVNDSALQPATFHLQDFSHTQNNFVFHFSTLNYATPSHTRYRYRLLGLETDWHNGSPTSEGLCTIEYRVLPPDTYTLEIQAAEGDGDWGGTTSRTFTIQPPLWLTWWAKLLYVLIGLACVVLALNAYLRARRMKMEKENEERVNHLFELREEARHSFTESTRIDPHRIGINVEEEELVRRMLKAIEQHLSDPGYGVDLLASDVFVSRSALYTKVNNMLGITPSDFIRNVRLKHAAELLANSDRPINEIADLVGYQTHKSFTQNFKKMFGILPSEYRGKGK